MTTATLKEVMSAHSNERPEPVDYRAMGYHKSTWAAHPTTQCSDRGEYFAQTLGPITVVIRDRAFSFQDYLTSDEARDLAFALISAADEVDAGPA